MLLNKTFSKISNVPSTGVTNFRKIWKVSTELIEKAQELACQESISVNFSLISKTMVETHNLLMMLLQQKRTVRDILTVFPHLKAFNGVMVKRCSLDSFKARQFSFFADTKGL